jgi:hypothetical protein
MQPPQRTSKLPLLRRWTVTGGDIAAERSNYVVAHPRFDVVSSPVAGLARYIFPPW